MHACTHTQQIHEHTNTFKATKDIAAGQEILVRYGGAEWFERRNIPYSDVDYASTMWRPDLHPLPCRQSIRKTTGSDGRHSFVVLKAVPSATVLEISLCVEVSVIVVDQFPVLRDFVLIGATAQTVCARENSEVCWQPSILIRTHICVSKTRRHACLCHTPRKSRPHPILTSLTCACHSQTWTKMYVSVVRAFCECMSKQLCAREKRVVCDFLCEHVLVYMCDLVLLLVCVG